jgi:broad specificity phosphatase PhoE
LARLLLVRHGSTEFNTGRRFMGYSDIDLNADGYIQAEKLRDYLADEKIDAVYSSDLRRALVTAEIISSGRRLDIVTCPELREVNYGTCEGLTFQEIGSRYPDVAEKCINFTVKLEFPEGETFEDFIERTNQFLCRSDNHEPSETILVVSHNGPLKVLVCRLLDIDMGHWWQIRIDIASLSVVDISPRGAMLSRLNDTSHLIGNKG